MNAHVDCANHIFITLVLFKMTFFIMYYYLFFMLELFNVDLVGFYKAGPNSPYFVLGVLIGSRPRGLLMTTFESLTMRFV